MQDIIGSEQAKKLLSRVAQCSLAAEFELQNMGINLDRANPQEAVTLLIEKVRVIPAAERSKIESLVIGTKCYRHWCKVLESGMP